MIAIGIVLGIFVFFLVAPLVGAGILHSNQAGVLPGIVTGIWTAWPFFHKGSVLRSNFLHPQPMEYKVPLKMAFGKVRSLLAEVSYKYGDKWHVVIADPQKKRILANLRFTDEESHIDIDARGHVATRKVRLQRFLELEVRFENTDEDSVVIQFDFVPKIEGLSFAACDSIVHDVRTKVDSALGPATPAGNEMSSALPPPPWWLLGLSAVSLLGLAVDVFKAVFL